ncbi:MAG: hypothetical protein RSB86_19285 [Comamonas sp.]|uniref:hypothetical protein n=1 Tax=Comamonas sp. TaxID=34028 RepID=UPI002FC9F530
MQQQSKAIPITTAHTSAPSKDGCKGCGQCQCGHPAPAPQPPIWERKRADDTEGGEL